MPELSGPVLMGTSGFLIGLAFGAVGRATQFCTLGAIADAFLIGERAQLGGWLIATAAALVTTQAADALGWIDLGQSIYLSPQFGWLGAIVGGLLFGFGMALVGTCGYGMLLRVGGGDLRSLVATLVLGIAAYMTLRGLTGVLREDVIESADLDLSAAGGQSLVSLIGGGVPSEPIRWVVVAALVGAILIYARPAFREPRRWLGGLVMGLLVTAGWLATGILGADDFEPARLESLTFVAPVGEALVYLMTFTGATIDFGIASVGGVIVGAFLATAFRGEIRIEGFDHERELLRHLIGASLMGFGGVCALGCTIGQGITGPSTLALASFLALPSIVLGACLGLHFLTTGRFRPGAWWRARQFR